MFIKQAKSYIDCNYLPKNLSTCHRSKNDAGEYRSASAGFVAISNPHNQLIEEWMGIFVHHLTTLPNPNQPYYLSRCSLAQA